MIQHKDNLPLQQVLKQKKMLNALETEWNKKLETSCSWKEYLEILKF